MKLIWPVTLLLLVGWAAGSPRDGHKRSKSDRDINAIGHRNIAYKGNWYSLDKEKQVAVQFSAAFEQANPLLQDAEIGAYVQGLAQKVARTSDAKLPITTRIADSDDVYAVTLPGGYQCLSRGLLLIVDDEAGLASVLARGIAHTALRSATMDQTRENLMKMATVPLILFGNSPGTQDTSLAVPLTALKFRREDEQDADYFGLQYEYKAGYDPDAFLRTVQTIWSLPRYSKISNTFGSFPPLSLRLAALRSEIDQVLPKNHSGIDNTSEFMEFKKHLLSLPPAKQEKSPDPKLIRALPENSQPK